MKKGLLLFAFMMLYGMMQAQSESDKTITVGNVSFKMVLVKGGQFIMGNNKDDSGSYCYESCPAHEVILSDYYIGEAEVTQELWEAVMGANPSAFKGTLLPVECVSWEDCQTFIVKLNKITGKKFRLPTEAEWEFAARGGLLTQNYIYAGGNNLDDIAWHKGNSGERTHEVKTKQSNELGLYDMSGNVQEWCNDWFALYTGDKEKDPQGPSSGKKKISYSYNIHGINMIEKLSDVCKVIRGNSWDESGKRLTDRAFSSPKHWDSSLGLRLVMSF